MSKIKLADVERRFWRFIERRLTRQTCKVFHSYLPPGMRSLIGFTTRGLDCDTVATCKVCGRSCTFRAGEDPVVQSVMNRYWIRVSWEVSQGMYPGLDVLTEITVFPIGERKPRGGKKIGRPFSSIMAQAQSH